MMIDNSIKTLSTNDNYYYIIALPFDVASNTNITIDIRYLTHVPSYTMYNKYTILSNIFKTNYICKIFKLFNGLKYKDNITFSICRVDKFNIVNNTADIIIIKPNDGSFVSLDTSYIFDILYILNEDAVSDYEFKDFSLYTDEDTNYCYNIFHSRKKEEILKK